MQDDTIIFSNVQTGSSAVYQCNVSNAYGYLLSNAFVNVLCESVPSRPHLLPSLMLFSAPIICVDRFSERLTKGGGGEAGNNNGRRVSAAEPPRVLTPANRVYQFIQNHRALMDCASFGSPIPKITW